MGYVVDMVGLVYFFNDRRGGGRIALLPNGTNPGNNIVPHEAAIYLDAESTPEPAACENWEPVRHDELTFKFVIDTASTLTISSCDTRPNRKTSRFYQLERANRRLPARLDTTRHDNQLPSLGGAGLTGINPDTADTIAQLPIRNGTLEAFQLRSPDATGAIVSRLTVCDHVGPVTITATPKEGAPRRITVRNGTEIVLANLSDDLTGGETEETAHFQIYRRLVPDADTPPLSEPILPAAPAFLVSPHPFFIPVFGTFPSGKCSNTCC